MPSITIKNIPDDLFLQIKESARIHRRSINSEIIVCLEKALKSHRIDPEVFLRRVRRMRQDLKVPPLTDDFLRQAKEEGRP